MGCFFLSHICISVLLDNVKCRFVSSAAEAVTASRWFILKWVVFRPYQQRKEFIPVWVPTRVLCWFQSQQSRLNLTQNPSSLTWRQNQLCSCSVGELLPEKRSCRDSWAAPGAARGGVRRTPQGKCAGNEIIAHQTPIAGGTVTSCGLCSQVWPEIQRWPLQKLVF